MPIHLPIAEMNIWVEQIFLLGMVVGLLSGMFGIGGGFLTTPFLIFVGIPPAVAVGTQSCQLAASSVTGCLSHFRRGNVDVQIASFMLIGSITGAILGIGVFKFLQSLGQIDLALSILYVIFLGGVGSLMMWESISSFIRSKRKTKTVKGHFNSKVSRGFIERLPFKMRFAKSHLYISAIVPIGIGFAGGLMLSIMGISGGFLLVPAMIYILGMPILLVAGTSLFQIAFTSVFSTMMHAVENQTVDIVLAALLISGGLIGTRLGVLVARFISPKLARVTLATLVLSVAVVMAFKMFSVPSDIFSIMVCAHE